MFPERNMSSRRRQVSCKVLMHRLAVPPSGAVMRLVQWTAGLAPQDPVEMVVPAGDGGQGCEPGLPLSGS